MKKYAALVAVAALCSSVAANSAPTNEQSCKLSVQEVATQFFDTFYIKKQVRSAFETWVVPNYIQHNSSAATGRDAAIAFLEPFFTNNPTMSYSIKRVIVEGHLAVVHSHGKLSPEDRGMAIVDIVRIEDCKVVEHWDVIQPVPATAMNDNGMF
ncbi:MAG: nuclear transport factor 2 family protein [Sphingorhabdus sp.]